MTGEFLAQTASNEKNVSIWWRHQAGHHLGETMPQYSLMQLSCVAASDWWRGIWQRDPFYLSFLLSKSITNRFTFTFYEKLLVKLYLSPQLWCHDIWKYLWRYDDQGFNHTHTFFFICEWKSFSETVLWLGTIPPSVAVDQTIIAILLSFVGYIRGQYQILPDNYCATIEFRWTFEKNINQNHDDVMIWKHFPHYYPFCEWNS